MDRHARYFLDLAERADNRYWEGDKARALSNIESDHDNVRAALRHFLASGDSESAARLAGGLSMFWFIRGHCGEGRAWLREVLAQVPPEGPSGNSAEIDVAVQLGVVQKLLDAASSSPRPPARFSDISMESAPPVHGPVVFAVD